ncbi:MAG: clan AA aspartic protease [Saprospiraceae bacterium]
MGKIYADIEITNTDDVALFRNGIKEKHQIRSMVVSMLVDSGAYNLSINEHIKAQLGLMTLENQIFELADGSLQNFEVVGPVEVRFKNRTTTTRAVVLPGSTEALLGQITMEDMDVVIYPREERMDVNPNSPLVPKKALK